MRVIDLETWPRRDHYRLFRDLDHPYFGVTVEVDVTAWQRAVKSSHRPFYPSMVHQVSAAANAVEAFRLRIRGEQVVLHDVVHPSFTVAWRDELFNFCTVAFEPDADAFLARALPAIAHAEAAEALILDQVDQDDMIFLSCSPWYAFTGLSQVGDAKSGDAFPRIAWGRVTPRDGRAMMAINVQLHHAVADGVHVAHFLEALEAGLAAQAASLAAER
jgi:chloramphenicol O-acetyltransferase type A